MNKEQFEELAEKSIRINQMIFVKNWTVENNDVCPNDDFYDAFYQGDMDGYFPEFKKINDEEDMDDAERWDWMCDMITSACRPETIMAQVQVPVKKKHPKGYSSYSWGRCFIGWILADDTDDLVKKSLAWEATRQAEKKVA